MNDHLSAIEKLLRDAQSDDDGPALLPDLSGFGPVEQVEACLSVIRELRNEAAQMTASDTVTTLTESTAQSLIASIDRLLAQSDAVDGDHGLFAHRYVDGTSQPLSGQTVAVAPVDVVEVCPVCDIAGCHHIGERAAAIGYGRGYATLTDQESVIVEKLGDIWNLFLQLPVEHQTANLEFSAGIHVLQNHVAARSAFRLVNSKEKAR